MEQKFLCGKNQYDELNEWIEKKNILLVCGKAFYNINKLRNIIKSHSRIVYFSHYQSNPLYDSIVEGVKIFKNNNCNAVMAIGGGSAIDVAKCIRIFSSMSLDASFLKQKIVANDVPLLVIPTTAGSGSESTRYAVIYKNGKKQSIMSDYCVPDVVLLDPDNLIYLSEYQKKSTMMDVLSHSIESMWSINSTGKSILYSKEAIRLFKRSYKGYLCNTGEGNEGMLMAANFAGKAINITQTTAGHAMCYKITSIFGCAHGHAAMICNRKIFPWMIKNIDKCVDKRGKDYLKNVFDLIGKTLGGKNAVDGVNYINSLYDETKLEIPHPSDEQLKELIITVNKERLINNPVRIDSNSIDYLYRVIFGVD